MLKDRLNVSTKVLTRSKTAFEWGINPYLGCSHGCTYCYGMFTTKKGYWDWINAKTRMNLVETLEQDICKLRKADITYQIQDIFLGAITDSYQRLERQHNQTRRVINVLIENELPFTIITKNDLVLRDIDLLKGYKWCRAGVTITSLDETFRTQLEPGTVSYDARVNVLKTLKQNGISTYLSCEPIMPVAESDPLPIVKKLEGIVDLFDFGMFTYHGKYDHTPSQYLKHYKDNRFYCDIFSNVMEYCNDTMINYCISSHSRAFFKKNKLPFKSYPLLTPETRSLQWTLTDFPGCMQYR